MKDKNQYLLRKICGFYIILVPIYYLLTYRSGTLFMLSSPILIVLAGFNYGMSKVENIKAQNSVYGMLYFIVFAGLFYVIFILSDDFSGEHIGACIILVLSIICPFFIYWYLKKKKSVLISIFILSFNFIIVTFPTLILVLLNVLYD